MDDRREVIDDEAKWRQRYWVLTATRVGGLLIALAGLLLMRGGVLTDEPFPVFGAILLVLGLFDATISPRILARMFKNWDRRP